MKLAAPPRTVVIAAMAFLVMLGSGAVIPSVRPMFASLGASESQMHAFMSVNMIGAAVGAPLLGAWADRRGLHRPFVVVLAALDALLLFSTTLHLGVPALLVLRTLQGATNVGVLSLVLGAIGGGAKGESHGKLAGVGGAAVMLAVSLGPAFGGALLRFGPLAPLRAASALALATAVLALVLGKPLGDARAPRQGGMGALLRDGKLIIPAALAFAERFTVGCFVVTFALYAHDVRHLTDAQTALGYSLFLIPFAVATYPLARTRAVSRSTMLLAGGLGYGLVFATFGLASGAALQLALVAAGVTSAMVYAPSLCLVAAAGAGGKRATAMAVFHGAGALGMMLGPAVAGIASAVLRRSGVEAGHRYAVVFCVGAAAQLSVMTLLAGRIRALRAGERTLARQTNELGERA